MQLEEECKNMANNIVVFKFRLENKELYLNLDSPNFSDFVREIINNNYNVSEKNILVSIQNDNKNIDIDSLKSIVIEVHKSYMQDLAEFYKNIEYEISTYYDDEDKLFSKIEEHIKQTEARDLSQKEDEQYSNEDEIRVLEGVGEWIL